MTAKEGDLVGEEMTALTEKYSKDCERCGPAIEEREVCLLAWDVEALFPSMSAEKTGEIVRKRIQASPIKPDGFDWKVGLVYLAMNRQLTGQLGSLRKILPHRRKVGGRLRRFPLS